MKKLNQKEWGVLGTSIGSMLIIVALLTMVGIGSGDTYAAGECVCGAGQTKRGSDCFDGSKWVGTCTTSSGTTDPSSASPESPSPASPSPTSPTSCPSGQYKTTSNGETICAPCPNGYYCPGGTTGPQTCPANSTTSASGSDCNCNSGYEKDHTGACLPKSASGETGNCASGTYKATSNGVSTCAPCPNNYYCPGGEMGPQECPANATCTAITWTCNDGYTAYGKTCVKSSGTGSDTNIGNCPAGTYYQGLNHAATCTEGYYCPGGTYNANTGDIIQGCERIACPENATCSASDFTCNTGYSKNSAGTACVRNGNGGTGGGGNGGTGGTGGNTGGTGGNGGNTGGNTGGNNGGNNTGGNNGGNNSNTNANPSTATKTPLVIVVIGMIAMGLGTFTYYKSKNNEI